VPKATPPMIYSLLVIKDTATIAPAKNTNGKMYANVTAFQRCRRVKQSSWLMVHFSFKMQLPHAISSLESIVTQNNTQKYDFFLIYANKSVEKVEKVLKVEKVVHHICINAKKVVSLHPNYSIMPRRPSTSNRDTDSQYSSPIMVENSFSWSQVRDFFCDKRTHIVIGVLIVAFAVFSLIAYISYFFTGAADQSLLGMTRAERIESRMQITNCLGLQGARLAEFYVDGTFGIISLVLIVMMGLYGLRLSRVIRLNGWRVLFVGFFWLVWGSVTFGFVQQITGIDTFFRWGGAHGEWIALWVNSYIQPLGTIMVLVVLLVIFLIITDVHFIERMKALWLRVTRKKGDVGTEGEEAIGREGEEAIGREGEEAIGREDDEPVVVIDEPTTEPIVVIENNPELEEDLGNLEDLGELDKLGDLEKSDGLDGSDGLEESDDADVDIQETEEVEMAEQQEPFDPRKDLEFYKFPTLDLLRVYDNETAPVINQEEQQANANRIVATLRNYGIEIEQIKATVGPTVTLYEVVPKAGIRIAKIQSLENDIMLSLSAIGIRIIAPMPGKGTVGIEVPNEKPQVVSMHSVIASKRFQEEQKMRLPVAIGRTITNEVFCFDLAKTPHLLVAGATGQGKSVGLNAIITSLLYKKHPAELKFVLVDPKMVEFSIYKPLLKHYMAAMPDQEDRDIIITDCQKVINTLNSLVIEMEDRYSLLAEANCRNVEDYNEKFSSRVLNPTKDVENVVTKKILHHHYMPYLVIVIDEYGDFIMQAGKEVERPIQRIAQKARAVGMHMILATQRPDVKIVTGTIKANIPTRIAFRTQSVVDSRTVLDAKGADQLIGKGDMLYSGGGNLTRIQCAFVDTPEVEAIVEHIHEQQGYGAPYQLPEYVPEGQEEMTPGSVDTHRLDPMFADVARYVVSKQEGSTSRLQRAFEIGYNRAGKLSDQLEATGIVGPNKGPKGRDVLIQDMESLERLLETLNAD